jgi:hypothetical protein
MGINTKDIALMFAIAVLLSLASCGSAEDTATAALQPTPEPTIEATPTPVPTPAIPDLQSELLDERGKATNSPLGNFDFKNHTYPLPRGWQHPDGDEITLVNGKLQPKFQDVGDDMSPEEKAVARAERRIGMSYVTTKFLDVDSDGEDEAAAMEAAAALFERRFDEEG